MIEGFDTVACGGTHCGSTGQVGLVKIRRWEKVRLGVRVEFYCGRRALIDYRWKNSMMIEMSNALTIKDDELDVALQRLTQENKELRSELNKFKKDMLAARAQQLVAEARPVGSTRATIEEFKDLTVDDCRVLANAVVANPGVVALFGSTADRPTIVAARSKEVDLPLKSVLSGVRDETGGKGGGSDVFFTITYKDVEAMRKGVGIAIEKIEKKMA